MSFISLFKRSKRVYYNFKSIKNKKALVLAPHADDETIGCGGTLKKLIASGFDVEVILFTNEAGENFDRESEFEQALKILGCLKYHKLKIDDGKLMNFTKEAGKEVLNILQEFSPSLIFAPYLLDDVPDHKSVSLILFECLLDKKIKDKDFVIAMYEVWSPISYPDYYIDISSVFEFKKMALTCYASQERKYKIINKVESLSALRAGLSFRRNIKYMEAFKVLSIDQFMEDVRFLKNNGWFENKEERGI